MRALYDSNMVQPERGYTLATTITCTPPEISDFAEADTITWYFGDGEKQTITYPESFVTTHTYKLPGVYSLSAAASIYTEEDVFTSTTVATASCRIINFIDAAIYFTVVPPPTLPGFYTQYPYKLIFSTTDTTTTPVIDLYSEFSRSYAPQDIEHKWSFVRPEWKFIDLSGNKITQITPHFAEIKIDGNGNISSTGTTVGLSGYAEFYFIDDIYSVDFFIKDAPTPIVWASIETTTYNTVKDSDIKSGDIYSYSTTEVRAYAPHVSYWKMPDYLRITENGIADFNSLKWVNAPIPFFVSAQYNLNNVGNIKMYDPAICFSKILPYAVSALGIEYVPCAEDIPVTVTVENNANTIFTLANKTTAANVGTYKLNQVDEYNFVAPGFTRGVVQIKDEGDFQISAVAVVDFDKLHLPLDALSYSPYVWLPNPAAGTLSMIYYTGALNKQFADALNHQFSTNAVKNIYTPVVNNVTTTSPGITGFNGIYAVAASPGHEPDYEYYTWVADADLDMLYRYNTLTELTTSIDLKSILNVDKVSPAYISLDYHKNLWVTCYDTLSVLKFDINGNLLFGVDPTAHVPLTIPDIPGMFDINPAVSELDDVMVIEPTGIDTDTNNDVWVSYSNPVSSYIIKYSSTGSYITSIHLDINSTPQDILINQDKTFWVAESFEVYGATGSLKKYNTDGIEISAFNNIPNLGYLTFDVDENPWFTYGYNKIGKIKNGIFTHVAEVTSSYVFQDELIGFTSADLNIPPITGPNGYLQYVALEGIAGSHKNLMFVVHSIDNKVYVYNARNDELIDVINITPQLMLGIYNDARSKELYHQQWNKSIQVIGDWTGIRWSKKYSSFSFGSKTLTGSSKILNLNKTNPQEVRKHNQDFNMSEQLRSFAMSPTLHENEFLFDKFFSAIHGTSKNIDDVGTVFYEKTANFLANHNDIDTCEIDNLYKIAEMLDITIDDYRLAFPAQLKQVLNLMSISHSKLWGIRCKCNTNFRGQANCTLTDICRICGKCKINNKGEKLNTQTLTVKVGVPLVIYEKNIDSYFLYYPATAESLSTYSVSHLTAAGLQTPIDANYEFYEYIPTPTGNLTEGVIDWDNKHTTLNMSMSTYNDWVKENGIIDSMLNFYLYRGLNLIP